MGEENEWSVNTNEAVRIALCQAGLESPVTLSTFHPNFTYPIFGEEERIFGYKNLRIALRFAAHDLWPNAAISYDTKFNEVADVKAADVRKILRDHLPDYAFDKASSYARRLQADDSAALFRPPGTLRSKYSVNGRNYEIWCAELTDPAVQALLERMQIFVSFFIEGGTYLALKDQEWTLARWRVFFVYEVLSETVSPKASPYSIVGYSTSYRFITFQPDAPSTLINVDFPEPSPLSIASLPCRARISQFVILPPHQHHSHGTHLYNAMIDVFLADPACVEITVEDPNESFDDLRDYCDHRRLGQAGALALITLNTALDPQCTASRAGIRVPTGKMLDRTLLTDLRAKYKLAPRQFDRLIELHLLSQIAPRTRNSGTARLTQRAKATDSDDRAFFYWRLLVKQRIYKRNKDLLIQLEHFDLVEQVEATLLDQLGDYERLLRGMQTKQEREEKTEANTIANKTTDSLLASNKNGEKSIKATESAAKNATTVPDVNAASNSGTEEGRRQTQVQVPIARQKRKIVDEEEDEEGGNGEVGEEQKRGRKRRRDGEADSAEANS